MINNFAELNHYLEQFVPGSIANGNFYNLENMFKIMALLDMPQEKLQVVHVAGTSGKTSTCYYTASLLEAAGAKVGLTISPHITEVNERVQINNQPLSEVKFCKLFNQFIAIPGILESKPTYFEILIAFAFWAFVEEGCTHAVVEVGLGGLLDGTNVVGNPEKVCVITDIGLDHTRILGETIDKIAYQKAGIIQHHNNVFCYRQGEVVDQTIDMRAAEMHAIVHRYDQQDFMKNTSFVNDMPNFQKRNWLLAREVAEYVITRDELHTIDDKTFLETQKVIIPARMQRVVIDGKVVICDGAHNPQKLEAFITSLKAQYPNKTFAVLSAFMESKKTVLHESLQLLHDVSDNLIVTDFKMLTDLPYKAIPAKELASEAKQAGFNDVAVEPDTKQALELLLSQKADIFVITGSFYLVSVLQPYLKGKHD